MHSVKLSTGGIRYCFP